jgi:hypothetical protein
MEYSHIQKVRYGIRGGGGGKAKINNKNEIKTFFNLTKNFKALKILPK